eukprot:PLAT9038.4.p2 GENE.PLAT9038.4~~PLAT9038.4.p2  ORF type:complete len:374 (+),score=171.47 PLAT9038.4:1161-2282(+)
MADRKSAAAARSVPLLEMAGGDKDEPTLAKMTQLLKLSTRACALLGGRSWLWRTMLWLLPLLGLFILLIRDCGTDLTGRGAGRIALAAPAVVLLPVPLFAAQLKLASVFSTQSLRYKELTRSIELQRLAFPCKLLVLLGSTWLLLGITFSTLTTAWAFASGCTWSGVAYIASLPPITVIAVSIMLIIATQSIVVSHLCCAALDSCLARFQRDSDTAQLWRVYHEVLTVVDRFNSSAGMLLGMWLLYITMTNAVIIAAFLFVIDAVSSGLLLYFMLPTLIQTLFILFVTLPLTAVSRKAAALPKRLAQMAVPLASEDEAAVLDRQLLLTRLSAAPALPCMAGVDITIGRVATIGALYANTLAALFQLHLRIRRS